MLEIRDPGLMAKALEIDLERYRHAQQQQIVRMPPALSELADALARIAVMLRRADRLGQAVDLGDEVVRLIEQFRGALRTVGGAPAQA